MGTITFSEDAPTNEAVHFSFGFGDFDLEPGKPYDTDEAELLRSAEAHPWLSVKIDPPAVEEAAQPDLSDPHVNPAADHLSEWASPEAKQEADANEEAIKESIQTPSDVQPQDVTPTDATVTTTPPSGGDTTPTPDPAASDSTSTNGKNGKGATS